MKKLGIILFILVFFLTGSSLLWAGGSDNKTNWSAEYIGILNRNAATDAADIVMYNPAGVMKMENGLYGNLSAHFIAKDYNNKINGTDFDQDEPSVVPGLFTVYKEDKWAAFFAVSNVIGGGEVDYKNGNATTGEAGSAIIAGANALLDFNQIPSAFWYTGISSQNLKAEAMGLGFTLGGAYEINDMWSVSLGIRYVKSTREMEGSMTVTATTPYSPYSDPLTADVAFEEEADGFGGIIGINFAPSDALNFGLHYDTKVDLDYEADVKRDTAGILPLMGIVDGAERSRNLPAVLAAGVSYKINPKIRVESNLTLYLNEDADFENSAVDNGYEIGIGVDYAFTDTLNATLGYLYTDSGVDKAEDMTPELPELNAHTLGAGLRYQMNDKLKLTFGLGHVFYDDASFVPAPGISITYEKAVTFVAFGMEYKFF
ncbi:OmpP1/FadL family transporter [Desulfobacula sp.]|uniref:OmpP1/FadL family transporter n=1 Tax=Desulfobacula sp. TaxID=2593537 RepID=UPI0025C4B172|nr:outer membrane protein transport protein [Desulfobacula sp.]MBC2703864.1 outer membrane protein transport protein [Desulfobacula sp.]